LQVDPPEHSKYRKLLDPIFAPKQMNAIEPVIAGMVNELIDPLVERGSCELTTDLAEPLPSTVFLGLMGLPLSDLDMFLGMKNGILRPAGDDMDSIRDSQRATAASIEAYFAEAMFERKKKPRDDLLSRFLTAEVDGARLTEEEIQGICFLFILAGLDTVTDSLECFFAYLAQHPEQRRAIVDDPAIIPAAVEELLRWETPVTTVARVVAADVELGGCPMHQGDHVGVMIGSANTAAQPAPRLRRRGAPVPRFPSGPAGAAHHPAGVAPPDTRLRARPGNRVVLRVGPPPGRPGAPRVPAVRLPVIRFAPEAVSD
jgi:cytochrome P450